MDDVITTELASLIKRTPENNQPVVVMTCGIAGSGKTTIAKAIEAKYPSFHRLSIDEIQTKKHGIYGVDYPASYALYEKYQDEADVIYRETYDALLRSKQDVIIERSFYAKEDRDEYRNIASEAGARVVLVYLAAEGDMGKEVLWGRICRRSEGVKMASNALVISRELFDKYWEGFEAPVGEGEVVIKVL